MTAERSSEERAERQIVCRRAFFSCEISRTATTILVNSLCTFGGGLKRGEREGMMRSVSSPNAVLLRTPLLVAGSDPLHEWIAEPALACPD